LRPGRLGVGEVRGAEHADEYLRLANLAGFRIGDPDPLAGIIYKRLVAGDMMLAHYRRQPPFEAAQQIAESRIPVPVETALPVFLPQDRHRDPGPFQLARQRRPVRLGAPSHARRRARAPEQPLFQRVVSDVVRQRPRQTRRCGAFQIVLDRRPRRPQTPPDLARAHALVAEPQ
jgi:hypothetical protein